MYLLALLILVTITLIVIYLGGKYNEIYWKKRGVKFCRKNKLLGVFWDFFTTDRAFFESLYEVYKAYPDEHAVGLGSLLTPTLYVKDPRNIQYVLSTEFNAFHHRGFEINEGDILAENILFLNGNKWKLLRQSMSPLFTTAKVKSMFYTIDKSAQDYIRYLNNKPHLLKGNTFDNLSAFCSAAIGATVFGVTTKSIFDSPFLKVAEKAFVSALPNIKIAICNLSLFLFKFLRLNLFKEYEKLFVNTVKEAIDLRKTENVKRHDFADICVSLQSKGLLKDPVTNMELEPTNEVLAGQAFFFFMAGVHPTAASVFAALVELGKHPDALQRLHEEIDEKFDKYNGQMSYDSINDMSYLDMVISEGMRLYPPIGYLSRLCTSDTILPVGNIKIDKGTKIFTPVFELHHDEKYYPNPESFIPERFARENKTETTDLTYMPFGKGGRICIGMKYGLLQAKTVLVHLLRNFTIKTNYTADCGIKFKKDHFQVRLKNVDVEFFPRN